ncbi:MAG: plasmid stabilization protein [Pseudomonas putida]|nr:plasmid stabilization protein [Pseudomonas putida]
MTTLTIHNLDINVRRAIQARARLHGHSMEAEARLILASAVLPEERQRLGDAMAKIGRKFGITDKAVAQLQGARDRILAQPMGFE